MTRVALVLGGARSGGMGRAIAEQFLNEGVKVVISDIGAPLASHPEYAVADETQLQTAVRELSHLGEIAGVECDVTDEEQVSAAFDFVEQRFGRVDIVVNCAGLAVGLVSITDLELRDWQVNIDVMATGAFLAAREAARRMTSAGTQGRIITIASQAGKTGMAMMAAYCSAKFAVIGLTQSLASELGKYGITVNAVCPGTIDTPLLAVKGGVYETFSKAAGRSEEDYRARLTRQIPVGRFGTVEDIASAVSYLASEQASFITGEALNVTGGQEVH